MDGDRKMREGTITSSVSLTPLKWLFQILINKQSNLSSTLCPVNWKLFEYEYETHIHYGRTYFLSLITTNSNNISVCLLSHMQIIFKFIILLCAFFFLLANIFKCLLVTLPLSKNLFICYRTWHLNSFLLISSFLQWLSKEVPHGEEEEEEEKANNNKRMASEERRRRCEGKSRRGESKWMKEGVRAIGFRFVAAG